MHIKIPLCNILPLLICMWTEVQDVFAKTFLEETFMCAPSFLCVHTSMTCVRADSLERTLVKGSIELGGAVLVRQVADSLSISSTFVLCSPPLSPQSTHSLRSADQGLLHIQFARSSARQNWALSVAIPWVWNSPPLALRSLPRIFSPVFLQQAKAALFSRAGVRRSLRSAAAVSTFSILLRNPASRTAGCQEKQYFQILPNIRKNYCLKV